MLFPHFCKSNETAASPASAADAVVADQTVSKPCADRRHRRAGGERRGADRHEIAACGQKRCLPDRIEQRRDWGVERVRERLADREGREAQAVLDAPCLALACACGEREPLLREPELEPPTVESVGRAPRVVGDVHVGHRCSTAGPPPSLQKRRLCTRSASIEAVCGELCAGFCPPASRFLSPLGSYFCPP